MDKLKLALAGLITGICNGLFGAGGGVVAVLVLEKLCKLDTRAAHATAISIMLPLTTVSAAVYAYRGGVNWRALAFTAPALIAGSFLGARLTGKISESALQKAFSIMMLLAGAALVLL